MLRDHDWRLARRWRVPLIAAALLLIDVPNASGQSSPRQPKTESPERSRDKDGYWPRDGAAIGVVGGLGVVNTRAWASDACPECDGGPMLGKAIQLDFGYNLRPGLNLVGAIALVESDPNLASGQSPDRRLKALTASLGLHHWLSPRWSIRGLVGAAGTRARAQMESAFRQRTSVPMAAAWASVEYEVMSRRMSTFALSLDTAMLIVDREPMAFGFLSAGVRFYTFSD